MKHQLTKLTTRHALAFDMCITEIYNASLGILPPGVGEPDQMLRQSKQAISIYISEVLKNVNWLVDNEEMAYLSHYSTHNDVMIKLLDIHANAHVFSVTGATGKQAKPIL